MSITQQLGKLESMLHTEHVGLVTHDATEVKPGKTTILVNPPEIRADEETPWGEYETRWTVNIIAGSPTTQSDAMTDIMQVIDEWIADNINIEKATPATFHLNNITLGCYEVTLGSIDL